MQVNASIEPSCTIDTSNFNFGIYKSYIITGMRPINVICTKGTSFKIIADAGGSRGSTTLKRRMTNGKDFLEYTFYQDSIMTRVWGINNGLADEGTGGRQTFNIYGKVFKDQNSPPGFYSDNVTISLSMGSNDLLSYQLTVPIRVTALIEKKD